MKGQLVIDGSGPLLEGGEALLARGKDGIAELSI
jgi:hypothetical protein